jgi:glycosyltransferase involved in cell wall biosynthesis
MTKKIIYFVTEDWYFCSHRLNLAVEALKQGYDVSVITRVNKHQKIISDTGINVIPIDIRRRGKNPISEIQTIINLIRIFIKEKPDILHNVAIKPVIYGTLAAKISRIPYTVNALAGMGWLFSSPTILAKLLKQLLCGLYKLLLKNTQVIVQNNDDENILSELGLTNIHVIRGAGVDTEVYTYSSEEKATPLVILPSRLLWDKGVGEFVEVARLLREKNINARFALIGIPDPDNPSSVSTEQVQQWNNEGAVEIWGYRADMPDVYRQSHIVCLPTVYGEGVPKCLIEAASCGRSIVTTDAPGCRDIVLDDVNGILIPGKDINALSLALQKLIENPGLREEMGKKGRELVLNNFTQEQVIMETLSLYKSESY